MRILITGSNGMLGSDLVKVLASQYEVSGIGEHPNRHANIQYQQVDLVNRSAVLKAISTLKPAVIVHTAAYTDVDGCELNPRRAHSVNVKGTEYIVEGANDCQAVLFFLSSDYVFDGMKSLPYEESDLPNPLSVYGRSKLEAEEFLRSRSRSAMILRSSWLFGENGRNFFKAILERIERGEELKVVNDQKGAPTYTLDLARAIQSLIEKTKRPQGTVTYHIANSGETTWFDAAKSIMQKIGIFAPLKPISSEVLNRPAKRPRNSVFNLNRIERDYGIRLRHWKEALNEFWFSFLAKK